MNLPVLAPIETIPTLIDRATSALDGARTSAEVLEARDLARVAYDAAKSAARMAKAKQAHDSIIANVHRAQANALAIRARAEMRLAEEYDAAQERGEVSKGGGRPDCVDDPNAVPATAADLGLRRDEIHEARRLRDAERADPGILSRSIDSLIERGDEPTRAALRREMTAAKAAAPAQISGSALWIWGRLRDFERLGVLSEDPNFLLNEMTEPMRADIRRLVPIVCNFLAAMEVQE